MGQEQPQAGRTSEDGDELLDEGRADAPVTPPSLARIDTIDMPVRELVRLLRFDQIVLASDFQRQADLWDDDQKSRLIESMLMRIPIPSFFFDGSGDKWLVIDGLQRLSALRSFVIDPPEERLRLCGLDFLAQFLGYSFDELPRAMQRRVEETTVTVHLIRPGTPPHVKYNIFRRLNTGGLSLTRQEIRHSLNPGPVQGFLKMLAEHPSFVRATGGSIRGDRMMDREYALRFCAFSMVPGDSFSEENFDQFLTDAMVDLNASTPEGEDLRVSLRARFIAAMDCAYALFQEHAFRKHFPDQQGRNPVNRALFECWAASLGRCADRQRAALVEGAQHVHLLSEKLMQTDTFINAISRATARPDQVRFRFRKVQNIITAVLHTMLGGEE